MGEWRDRGFVQDSDQEDETEISSVDSEDHESDKVISSYELGEDVTKTTRNSKRNVEVAVVIGFSERLANAKKAIEQQSKNQYKTDIKSGGHGGLSKSELGKHRNQNAELPGGWDDTEDGNIHKHRLDTFVAMPSQLGKKRKHNSPAMLRSVPRTPKEMETDADRDIFDIPSSPLSDVCTIPSPNGYEMLLDSSNLPTLPATSSSLENVKQIRCSQHTPRNDSSSRSVSPILTALPLQPPADYSEDMPHSHVEKQQTVARRRTFRPRNPIQLHPYLLENEQYRNTLRARGIRPVTVVGPHLEQAQPLDFANLDVLDTRNSSPFEASSPLSTRSSPLVPPIRQGQLHHDPDYGEMNSSSPEADPFRLWKTPGRQLLTKSSLQAAFGTNSEEHRTEIDFQLQELPAADASEFTMPHKFIHVAKGRVRKKYRMKRFKMPLGFSKAHLPTPDTSSETGLHERANLDLQIDAEAGLDEDDAVDCPDDEPEVLMVRSSGFMKARSRSSSPPSSVSSAGKSEQIRAAQRRIRGVLPASYLTLQQRAQTQLKSKSRNRPLTDGEASKHTVMRGIARKLDAIVPPSGPGRSSSVPHFEISDDSDSVHSSVTLHRKASSTVANHARRIPLSRLDVETQDVVEDNWIDPMAPNETRNRWKARSQKSQLRLEQTSKQPHTVHSHIHKQRLTNSRDAAESSHLVPRKRHRTDRARRKSILKRSVIDSSSLVSPGPKPDFLKIAVRQARSRADGGRHRPSEKLLSFHDRRDEAEVQTTLNEWTTGLISRYYPHNTATKSISQREPFTELSHNHQQKLPKPKKVIDRFSSAQCQPRQGRLGALSIRPRLRQRQLDVTRQPHNRPSLEYRVPTDDSQGVLVAAKKTKHVSREFNLRPGQLEDLEVENDEDHQDVAFQRGLLTRDGGFYERRMYQQRTANPLLNTYLNENNSGIVHDVSYAQQMDHEGSEGRERLGSIPQLFTTNHRSRKRPPQRINVADFDIDIAPPSELPSDHGNLPPPRVDVISSLESLQGLGKFGTFYTSDFEVRHFPVGTYFQQSTFIGSGEFQAALILNQCDVEQPRGVTSFVVGNSHFKWSAWTDEVSTQLDILFNQVYSSVAQESLSQWDREMSSSDEALLGRASIFRTILRYISSGLHFLDAVDRISFLERVLQNVQNFFDSLRTVHRSDRDIRHPKAQSNNTGRIRLITYIIVLLYQIRCIAQHPLIQPSVNTNIELLLRSTVCLLTEALLQNNLQELWTLTSAVQRRIIQQSGLRDEHVEIESIVVLSHVLPRLNLAGLSFWVALKPALAHRSVTKYNNIAEFDKTWHNMFSILPNLAFDTFGVLGSRNMTDFSDGQWAVIKSMLCRLFSLYASTSTTSETTINSYVRATLGRCFNLVHKWQWSNAEVMLNCIFDFFARSGLSLLQHEDSKGSPAFMTNLGSTTSIDLEPGDRSFDVFLKILYITLKQLSLSYPVKKLRSIAWRFIPNGSRLLEKEKELCQSDLNTTRNHHDLLCVLYSAVPPTSRPNVDIVRDLVDFMYSHSEVCRVNIRSWTNLVHFQLSTEEPKEALDSFAKWYNKFLDEMILQHRNARIEAECQFEACKIYGENLSANLLESTIANNQKQTESLMIMALASLRDCIKDAKNAANALSLFKTIHIASILELFDPKIARFDSVIIVALEVYEAFLRRLEQPLRTDEQQQINEDSQEFGDWSALDDICINADACPVDDKVSASIQTLLSNCFGAETFFNESLLIRVTDTWLHLCFILVKSGYREWSYYLHQHSPGSWQKLRNTDHTRKFFPYFMASILALDDKVGATHQDVFISIWMASLVERESMLKFQDRLTTALLNSCPQNPLLQNLPFVLNSRNQIVEIGLSQLRERRLGLISSVLSNMRHNFEAAMLRSANEAQQLRIEYSSMLRHFMITMRSNYQETQHSSSTRGAYVEIVQKIVEFLQQYTNEICPIDPFFTDSAAFPLPSSDPTYVVGRLKSYAFGLSDIRAQKKLAIFIQSMCERAVVDNQQDYLVGQMQKAAEGSHEMGISARPSIRTLLIRAVLPAYLELLSESDCGWILANILLDAATHIFESLLFNFSIEDKSSRGAVISLITDFLTSGCHVADRICTDTGLLLSPHLPHTLNSVYRATTRVTSIVDFIHRTNQECGRAIESIANLVDISYRIPGQHDSQYRQASVYHCVSTTFTESPYQELKNFCKRELEASMSKNWVKHHDEYYVHRGSSRREVIVDLGTVEEEHADMMEGVAEFLNALRRLPTFKGVIQPQIEPVNLFAKSIFM